MKFLSFLMTLALVANLAQAGGLERIVGKEPKQKRAKTEKTWDAPGIGTFYNVADIRDVASFIETLYQDGFKPEEVVLVCDIDDTLVEKHSDKANAGIHRERKGAVATVKKLHKDGVHLVASSSNLSPRASLKKLRDVDLLRAFGVDQIPELLEFQVKSVRRRDNLEDVDFQYYRVGNVIAARREKHARKDASTSFVRKAIATHFAMEDMTGIKVVVFVDNHKHKIKIYKKDVRNYLLFGPEVEHLECFDLITPTHHKARSKRKKLRTDSIPEPNEDFLRTERGRIERQVLALPLVEVVNVAPIVAVLFMNLQDTLGHH